MTHSDQFVCSATLNARLLRHLHGIQAAPSQRTDRFRITSRAEAEAFWPALAEILTPCRDTGSFIDILIEEESSSSDEPQILVIARISIDEVRSEAFRSLCLTDEDAYDCVVVLADFGSVDAFLVSSRPSNRLEYARDLRSPNGTEFLVGYWRNGQPDTVISAGGCSISSYIASPTSDLNAICDPDFLPGELEQLRALLPENRAARATFSFSNPTLLGTWPEVLEAVAALGYLRSKQSWRVGDRSCAQDGEH